MFNESSSRVRRLMRAAIPVTPPPPPHPPPPNSRASLALRLSRLSPLLLLAAAALAVLAVFIVNQAPPASADHTSDEVVWSATLTVKQLANTVGCDDAETATGNKCSTAATLTDNDFTYGGQTYRVTAVQLGTTSPQLSITISGVGTTPQTLGALRFRADNYSHALADAQTFIIESFFFPTNPGWSVGDEVDLKLVKRYWTGVDLYSSDADDDLEVHSDGAQTMDVTKAANGSGTFKVRLTQAPTANVTISFSKLATGFGIDDFDAVTVSPETLTFTTSNWQTGQEATVSAAPDAAVGDSIIISARVSIAAGANTFDPYRNPDRRNGFVVTVKAGGL